MCVRVVVPGAGVVAVVVMAALLWPNCCFWKVELKASFSSSVGLVECLAVLVCFGVNPFLTINFACAN